MIFLHQIMKLSNVFNLKIDNLRVKKYAAEPGKEVNRIYLFLNKEIGDIFLIETEIKFFRIRPANK